ncbi:beta-xylanase [Elysia marginata]|uniref:Beta-xylanase n=1 Tax=Elysia marginata TaxID=1093978 RepID=A0AAV4EKA0_9GAST|nr:beta-xylanase [Elysia marginata]
MVLFLRTPMSQDFHGPRQQVNVTPGARYAFKAYIQLIDGLHNQHYEKAVVKIRFTWKDDGSRTNFLVAKQPNLSSASGWVLLGSDFAIPNREFTKAILYIMGPSPQVDFYFDDASLKEIPENLDWKSEANARIEQLRKSNLHLEFNIGPNFDRRDLMVQVCIPQKYIPKLQVR